MVRRTAENMFVLAFSRQEPITDKHAAVVAKDLEAKAYNTAKVESQTTTGSRPATENVKAYARWDPPLSFLPLLVFHSKQYTAYVEVHIGLH